MIAVATPASGRQVVNEVDLAAQRPGQRCLAVQKHINAFVKTALAKRSRETHTLTVRTNGARITARDHWRPLVRQPDGSILEAPYSLCLGILPARDFDDDRPIVDGSSLGVGEGQLEIVFEGPGIESIDARGLGRPGVFLQLGAVYLTGYGGGSLAGVVTVRGRLRVDYVMSDRGDWPSGKVVAFDPATLVSAPTSYIMEFWSGATDVDVAGLHATYVGFDDTEDIGILHTESFGARRSGGLTIMRFGGGSLRFYGHIDSTYSNLSFPYCGHCGHVAYGDPWKGGQLVHWNQCALGGEKCAARKSWYTSEARIRDFTIEGSRWYNFAVFGGAHGVEIASGHIEYSPGKWKAGHNVMVGAGVCGGDHPVCTTESDCDEGVPCVPPTMPEELSDCGGYFHMTLRGPMGVADFWVGPGATGCGPAVPTLVLLDNVRTGKTNVGGKRQAIGIHPKARVPIRAVNSPPLSRQDPWPSHPALRVD